jgi:hypothetical protein
MQSHASPGGGVGTNFVKARFRLGSPRMPQLTVRNGWAEGDLNADAEWRVNTPYVIPSEGEESQSSA